MGGCIVLNRTEELYNERIERIEAAINLKTPDRVPIALSFSQSFIARYGGTTVQELMYNPEKQARILEKLMAAFPEADTIGGGSQMVNGMVADVLGQVMYKIPGREISPDAPFQFVEGCNMLSDEYDQFIENPTEFLVNTYFPRIFKEEWDKGPTRAKIALVKGIFALTDYRDFWAKKQRKWRRKFGFPSGGGGFSKAPFDVLSDTLRGMRESSLDLYRRPEKVIKACEALVPYCVKYAELPNTLRKKTSAYKELKPQVGMPLHRGNVPFMSLKQFEKFYWPTLKEVILQLVADGFICRPFAEGDWTMNMKYWREVPRGKVVVHIDLADMCKAKEVIGDIVCLQGNLPASLLEFGTPREVEKYCEKLIDVVGEGGGYIMDTAAGISEGAKMENIVAMTRFTAKYKVNRR